MARIETDPNYTAPTFSRATAGTDLFKKEDVQGLAAAMSAHTHNGSTTGLTIAPAANTVWGGAIQNGTITSAHIQDGTVVGSDIADNTVQWRNLHPDGRLRFLGAYSTLLNWSTSAPGWTATPITVTLGAASSSHKHLLIQTSLSITSNTAGNGLYTALGWNGSGPYTVGAFTTVPVANYLTQHSWVTYVSPANSFTSFGLYVNGGGALITISNAAVSALNVWEVFMP